MNNFEYIKSLSIDKLAEWFDQHIELDGTPWATWFDETYCSKCEPEIGTITDTGREIKLAWCEIYYKCRFIDFIPDGKQIVKLWLESEGNKNE